MAAPHTKQKEKNRPLNCNLFHQENHQEALTENESPIFSKPESSHPKLKSKPLFIPKTRKP
jgi:hypothetical protein